MTRNHARAPTRYLPVSPQEEHPPAHRVLLPEGLPVQRGDRPRMPHLPAEVHGLRGRGGLPGHGREGPERTPPFQAVDVTAGGNGSNG